MRPRLRPLLFALLAVACSTVGTKPIPGEPPHHVDGGFRNPNPEFRRAGAWTRFAFIARRALSPSQTIDPPRVENDGRALRENGSAPTVTWIGHATILVQLEGVNLLTDPHWAERASPLSWAGPRRLQPPGLRFEDLPPIHLVAISHDHYDHLNLDTVQRLAASHDPIFSGDTGYFGGFAEGGRRLGPFDLAAMAIGAYEPPEIMRAVHLTPEQAVQAAVDLRARTLLGIHWGTFDLADEPIDEPPRRMLAETERRGIPADRAWILKYGETRSW